MYNLYTPICLNPTHPIKNILTHFVAAPSFIKNTCATHIVKYIHKKGRRMRSGYNKITNVHLVSSKWYLIEFGFLSVWDTLNSIICKTDIFCGDLLVEVIAACCERTHNIQMMSMTSRNFQYHLPEIMLLFNIFDT